MLRRKKLKREHVDSSKYAKKTTKCLTTKSKIMNKFIIIIFIFLSNSFLLCKRAPNNPAPAHKDESQALKTIHDSINNEQQANSESSIKNLPPIKITSLHDDIPDLTESQTNIPQTKSVSMIKPAEWILESSIDSAPQLLKGIFFYLQSRSHHISKSQQFINIPSFHRFILVGPPGTGKTTLAHAIAHMLDYSIIFIPASALLGKFKNETAININKFLTEFSSNKSHTVIIIDELHKLFEHHANEHTDDSQSAAAFWLALDKIEKYNPHIIVIGTANNVDKLPPEIKSRFAGKIINMPPLNKNQKIQTFKQSIAHDLSVTIDDSVNDMFLAQMVQQIHNCSLRDIKLIIDSAKIFYYAEQSISTIKLPIILTQSHFQQALDQLQTESQILEESIIDKFYKKTKKYGVILSAAVNTAILIRAAKDLLGSDIIRQIIT